MHLLPLPLDYRYVSFFFLAGPGPLPEIAVSAFSRSPLAVGRGVLDIHAWPLSYERRPSHPYNAGTEHVGFSPTRQTLLAPSAKRREVFGESREG